MANRNAFAALQRDDTETETETTENNTFDFLLDDDTETETGENEDAHEPISPTSSIQKIEETPEPKKRKSSLSPVPRRFSSEANVTGDSNSESPRLVTFTGVPVDDSSTATATTTNVNSRSPAATPREEVLEVELRRLREKLTKVQIDYQAEKATRKRKEKNLVKLAKELNKRATEIEFKDSQIARVRACIRGYIYWWRIANSHDWKYTKFLTNHTNHRSCTIAYVFLFVFLRVYQQMADTVNEMEQFQLATGTEAADGHDRELAAAQQNYRAACREYDARLQEIKQEHDDTCRELHGQITESSKQVASLRKQLKVMQEASTAVPTKTSPQPSQMEGKSKAIAVLGFVVAIVMLVLSQYDLLSTDAVCAPAMPGTTLDMQDAVFEAPWWAPPAQKELAFGVLCGSRPRSKLVVSGGKLTAYSLLGSGLETEASILWYKRAVTADVGSRMLTLRDKKGHAEHVESPWLL
jgi:hypothetical protein